jgi:DNA repair exonuclease SbcCD ATPase subunit
MYLPIITGYELGQFVRILMWIFVPVAILSMLVTTWLHYRRRRRNSEEGLLSIDGFGGEGFVMPLQVSARSVGRSSESGDAGDEGGEEHRESVYKSILWMKQKYEQYRDMSDQRYEQLKEELVRSEKKYDDLLASIVEVKVGDRREKLLSATAHAVVEERAQGTTFAVVEERSQGTALAIVEGRAANGQVDGVSEGGGRAGGQVPDEPRPVLANMITAAEIERDSLRDLLAERNQQIIFLQRQLDQRIKDFHLAEHEGRGARGQIQELEEQAARTRQRLEEEAGRIRHQLEDEIARGRRQLEEQTAESKRHLEEQEANAERKLEEKQRVIVDLEEQILILRQKIEELVDKLRNNSQLLLNIYQELDKSLRSTDAPAQQ